MNFVPGDHDGSGRPALLELEADACVIGSGAGGATAACALAQAGLRVVVLEEGRRWSPQDFRPTTPWAFRNLYAGRGTRATQGNCVMPLPGGRGVGGSTLINSAICFRTPPKVLAAWRDQHGIEALDDARMNAHFARIWTTIGVSVTHPAIMGENNDVFRRGAEALGLDGHWMERSAPGCVGCGTCQQGCGSGGKWSVDRTFLAEAITTGRVAVHASCRATDLILDKGRMVAVEGQTLDAATDTPAGRFRVRAKVFVLAAGAVATPRLLRANGLGEGPLGENLHVHPTSCVFGRFSHRVDPWRAATQGYYVDRWDEGYLLQTFNMPVDQYYASLALPPDEAVATMADLGHLASAGVVVHDEDSVGSVGASTLHYDLGDGDRRKMLAGLREAARVYFAAGAEHVIAAVQGAGILRSMAEVERALGDHVSTWDLGVYASHPMGTCRMGADAASSVCTPEARVRGVDNLHVIDASVFPTSLGVNPQVTIMALGLTFGAIAARGV